MKRDGTPVEYRYAAYKPASGPAADTVAALIAAYQRSPEWSALADATRAWRTIYLKPLSEVGGVRVAAVTRRALLTIRDAMLTGHGPGAGRGFIAAAAALFAWAVDREWIEHSPVHRIKSPPGGTLRAWTRAEADKAVALLPDHLARVVVLARATGQRRGDLCAMVWSQYDGVAIRLTQQKTGAALVIPLAQPVRDALDAWRAAAVRHVDPARDPILRTARGAPWAAGVLSNRIPVELGKVGMPAGLNVHGLRKLAATELADAGCTPHEIAAITGHRTLAMVQVYTRSVDQERLAGAAVARRDA